MEHGLGTNAGGTAVPLLERVARHEHPGAAPAQRVASERRSIARQHDQRDLDVFTEAAGVFRKGQRACAGDELEAVAAEQARHLLIALRIGEHQRAAHHGDVGKIGSRGEIRTSYCNECSKERCICRAHAIEAPSLGIAGICSFHKCRSTKRSPARPHVPSASTSGRSRRPTLMRKMQVGSLVNSTKEFQRRSRKRCVRARHAGVSLPPVPRIAFVPT